jgi:glycosyltransferase involved in cell wall biosynthesis
MPWNGDIIWKKDRSFLHDLLVKRSLRLADLVPLQTNYLKNRCIELGVDKRKIKLVQFGVDIERFKFKGDIETVKRSLNINTDNVVISTRNINYNVIKIIEAIPIVLDKIPDATFVFIWPNIELDANPILKRIKELGVEMSVRIVGRVDKHDDLPKYLFIARTFVSVSTIDCFPQTALEAMVMKVFLVMGDVPPVRAYIENEVDAILVEPLNTESIARGIVHSLKIDNETRNKAVEDNYKVVCNKANFNKEMEKMEKLYYGLVGE